MSVNTECEKYIEEKGKSEKVLCTHDIACIIARLLYGDTNRRYADDVLYDEFGIWWVNDYGDSPWGPSINCADDEAEAFRNKMVYEGFYKLFEFGDDNAKESHFEASSVGGDGRYYADNCDFFYFCGHGHYRTFYFGTDYDGDDLWEYEVRADAGSPYNEPEWGDADLEWAFLQCCSALKSSYKTEWNDAFEGLHGICGFDTYCNGYTDGRTGNWTAYYLTEGGKDIHDAWKEATKKTQPSDVDAAIYRAKVRIDTEYYDYGDEYIDNTLPDYGEVGVLFVAYLYNEWDCTP